MKYLEIYDLDGEEYKLTDRLYMKGDKFISQMLPEEGNLVLEYYQGKCKTLEDILKTFAHESIGYGILKEGDLPDEDEQ